MENSESNRLKGFSEEEKLLWGLDLVRAKREGRVEDIPKIMKKRSEYLEIREKCLTLQEQISECRYNEFEKKQKLLKKFQKIDEERQKILSKNF